YIHSSARSQWYAGILAPDWVYGNGLLFITLGAKFCTSDEMREWPGRTIRSLVNTSSHNDFDSRGERAGASCCSANLDKPILHDGIHLRKTTLACACSAQAWQFGRKTCSPRRARTLSAWLL